jgi:rhodanese-related sulfurtransferase
VVDVREPVEWTTGHVPGALLIPLGTLGSALPAVPRDRPIVTICEAGVRSCTAASILAAAGFTDVAHVPAGSSGYRRSGLPLAFPDPQEVDVS